MSTGKTKASEGVHRLNNILVEEVSVVDRAANKRRFLLVKREGVEMTELRSNGRGGFTKVAKAKTDAEEKPENDEQEEETEKAGKPFPGAAKPFGAKPDDEEGDDGEGKDPKKKKPKTPPSDTKKEDASGLSLVDDLTGCIEDLISVATAMRAEEMAEGETVAARAAKAVEGIAAVHKRLGAVIEKSSPKPDAEEVAKVGRKMSKDRLAAFSGAMDTLGKLLTELMASSENNGAASAEKTEKLKVATLTKAMDDLVTITKAQQREIERLKKGVSIPNSTPVETGTRKRTEKSRDEEVSWPLDMNRPLSEDDKD